MPSSGRNCHAVPMPATWEDLIEALNTWAEAREVSDGIEVTFGDSDGARRMVQVVMTRSDWEELAWVIQGVTPETLRESILGLDDYELFLVCDSGVELVPSHTRDLPPDPLDEYRPAPGGFWAVMDDKGNLVSRFSDGLDERG